MLTMDEVQAAPSELTDGSDKRWLLLSPELYKKFNIEEYSLDEHINTTLTLSRFFGLHLDNEIVKQSKYNITLNFKGVTEEDQNNFVEAINSDGKIKVVSPAFLFFCMLMNAKILKQENTIEWFKQEGDSETMVQYLNNRLFKLQNTGASVDDYIKNKQKMPKPKSAKRKKAQLGEGEVKDLIAKEIEAFNAKRKELVGSPTDFMEAITSSAKSVDEQMTDQSAIDDDNDEGSSDYQASISTPTVTPISLVSTGQAVFPGSMEMGKQNFPGSTEMDEQKSTVCNVKQELVDQGFQMSSGSSNAGEPSADEMLQNVLSKQAKEIAVNPDLLNEDARPSGSQTPGDTGEYLCRHEGCNKSFKSESGLNLHMRRHTDEFPYVCWCGRKFSNSHKFDLHQHKQHVIGKSRAYRYKRTLKCRICNVTVHSESGRKVHEAKHNNEVHTCHLCSKTFACESYLKRHLRTHETNLPCPVCNKVFHYKAHLGHHMNIHIGAELKCHLCNFTSKHQQSYRRHMKNIHGPGKRKSKVKGKHSELWERLEENEELDNDNQESEIDNDNQESEIDNDNQESEIDNDNQESEIDTDESRSDVKKE